MTKYLHGVTVNHSTDEAPAIQSVGYGVIGLVATAPNCESEFEFLSGNTFSQPLLVKDYALFNRLKEEHNRLSEVEREKAVKEKEAGNQESLIEFEKSKYNQPFIPLGNLKSSLDGIFAQTRCQVVVVCVKQDGDNTPNPEEIAKGVEQLTNAESVLGVSPKIIIAPEYSALTDVRTAMISVAERLSAFAMLDVAPEMTLAKLIKDGVDFAEKRVEVVAPRVKVGDEIVPASPYHAGVMARIHSEKGFWWSNSNQVIRGIDGLAEPVSYKIDDAFATANQLNDKNITTIIRQNGYRVWGNRTTASTAKMASFKNIVITNDVIADSLTRAHQWALDRNITSTYVEDVVEQVNNFLRQLTKQGAIAGGRCWADQETNTADTLRQGKVTFDYEFSCFSPAEQITFNARMTKTFLKEII
jgi:phage tail sheath protein FI